jgi:AraC-like DNA-binding protein
MNNTVSVKTVSSLWIHALLLGAELQGVDREVLLEAAELDASALSQPYARVSLEQTMKIWRAAEHLSAQDDLGLLMGEQVKPSHFQLFAMSLMHSETLEAAFQKSIRYTRLVSDGGEYSLIKGKSEAAIVYRPQQSDFSRHQIDAVMVLLRNFANWLACKSLPLIRVEVTHPAPEDLSNYQRIFAAPIQFAAEHNALVFDPEILDEPLAFSDEKLAQMHERMLEEQLALLQQSDTANLVQNILRSAPELSLDREEVAAQLYMSARTLQRKLQELNTSFQQLLESERKRRAEDLLSLSELSLTAISDQLGFAESSAFSRAFKRWYGVSPLEYRQQTRKS